MSGKSPKDPYVLNAEVDANPLSLQNIPMSPLFVAYLVKILGSGIRSVLNLGAGGNEIGNIVAQVLPEARIVAAERSPRALELAKAATTQYGYTNVEYVEGYEVGDVLPEHEGGWEVVILSLLLEHVDDVPMFLRQIRKKMVSGGSIVIRTAVSLQNLMQTLGYAPYGAAMQLVGKVMAASSARLAAGQGLPDQLKEAGFDYIQTQTERYLFGGPTELGKLMIKISRYRMLSLVDAAELAEKAGVTWQDPYTQETKVITRQDFVDFVNLVHDQLEVSDQSGVMEILITFASAI